MFPSKAAHLLNPSARFFSRFAVLFVVVTNIPFALADDGALLFKDKCASCHTIGGGNLVGPDLNKSRGANKDELAGAIKRMEGSVGPLSETEVQALIAFLKSDKAAENLNGGSSKKVADGAPPSPMPEPTAGGSEEMGKKLFEGNATFSRGGMACIACHSTGGTGGTMGGDLTLVSSKMSRAALESACEKTPFKIMRTAYKDHPLTRQEAKDVAAYLAGLPKSHPQKSDAPITVYGSLFAAAVFAAIGLGYRNRNTGVRRRLKRR